MAIEICYYLGDTCHASRTRSYIPRGGDEVRLRSGLYTVTRVVWIEDEGHPVVAIDIAAVGQP